MRLFRALKLILTLKCEQSSHLASDAIDRQLDPAERWAVLLHTIGCRSCRRLRKQLRKLCDAAQRRGEVDLAAEPGDSGLSPVARKRIALAMRNFSARMEGRD